MQAWTAAYHDPPAPHLFSDFQRAGALQQAIVLEVPALAPANTDPRREKLTLPVPQRLLVWLSISQGTAVSHSSVKLSTVIAQTDDACSHRPHDEAEFLACTVNGEVN